MKWIECNSCKAQTPIADNDDFKEWLEPCDVCSNYGWHEFKPSEHISQEEIYKILADSKAARERGIGFLKEFKKVIEAET